MDFDHSILVVSSGQRTDRPFRNIPGFKLETIDVEELKYQNLYGFTAVIIASWSNETTLSKSTKKLSDFVNKGGILVCLGCQCHESQWIPFCHWNKGEPIDATWVGIGEDYNIIFDNIDHNLINFHGFIGHGTLDTPTKSKNFCNGDGKSMMCVIDEGVKGAALITTIDPDFHACIGRINDKVRESEIRNEAKKLLENIYNWCLYKFNKKHSVTSFALRKFIGFFRMSNFYLFLAMPIWIVSLVVSGMFFYKTGSFDPLVAIPSAASMIALAITITDKYMARKRRLT